MDDNIVSRTTASIFGSSGASYIHSAITTPTFVTFVARGGKGGGTSAFYTKAPAMNITLVQSVDHSVSKALGGDYIISTFGHRLVKIDIDGLDIYGSLCSLSATGNTTIQSFYNRYNVHSAPKARIDVSASAGGAKAAAFRCVVVGLTRKGSSAYASRISMPGVGDYTLNMIGVQL